ncbi:hypothetical protein SAMN05421747_10665 [Parapedobacter composti]|uniref:Uncharacterized protein n=1 Tax=Parapedobacter composti TaxID=623281 RepID=A0A1I1H9P4_9SPHI|nr:hypothetical protein [Parapedobacter composti]SFC20312.1 hypothetical protein SAMN05421747_10665 [Parapedobacter composti]
MDAKVLVTQGMCPLAQRVARLLPAATVLFGSADDLPEVLLRTGNYLKLPQPDNPAFVHEVLKRCLDSEVQLLIPLGLDELYPLAAVRPLFSEYGIAIGVPTPMELDNLVVVQNPPKAHPLLILQDGRELAAGAGGTSHGALSGVFTPLDSGEGLALCCVGG